MTAGELVIYAADPLLFGKLLILEVNAQGLCLCEAIHADKDGTLPRELFRPEELQRTIPELARA